MLAYLKSKEFWLTLLGLILFGVLSFVLLFYVFLPGYTMHAESVLVPELNKLTLTQVEEKLNDLDLEFEVTDSVYLVGMEPRSVVSQDPGPHSKVKPGRKIYLTVNKVVPPLVKFPNVLHVSNYQAKLRLDSWGLSIKDIIYIPNELRNVVLKAEIDGKEIKVGQMIPVGTRVNLIVGKGLGSQYVELPDLVGLPYQSAISKLHELGLNIGGLRFKPESKEEEGMILQQRPEFMEGDSVNLGTTFDLFISGPEPAETFEIPID